MQFSVFIGDGNALWNHICVSLGFAEQRLSPPTALEQALTVARTNSNKDVLVIGKAG